MAGLQRTALVCLGVAVLVAVGAAPALADRDFSTRFSVNDTGELFGIANALETCPTQNPSCAAAQNASPGQGSSYDNNDFTMTYVNSAPGMFRNQPTFDSSSGDVVIPAGATVLWAGLYWGADTSKGSSAGPGPTPQAAPDPALNSQVGFRTPTSNGYQTVNATTLDTSTGTPTRYSAFADVTQLVQAGGTGTYAVADVEAGTGSDRYAGWSLVVVIHDSSMPARNMTVDDGLVTVQSNSKPISVPLGGFQTPPAGPVTTTVGVLAWEGDTDLTGDSLSLNNKTLSDAGSPANNFFDGSITDAGVNVTARNPAFRNNMAVDAELVNANGVLPNNATSATVTFTTNGDIYFPAVIAFQTELYAPEIQSTKSVQNLTHPGGPAQHGDTLKYTVSYTNTGQDAATNFVMNDAIPAGTTYKPGTLNVTTGPQSGSPTDAVGDDNGEYNAGANAVRFRLGTGATATTGGEIAPGETDTVTFDVTVDSSDVDGQQIANQAHATFLGKSLGTSYVNDSPKAVTTVATPDLEIFKSNMGGYLAGSEPTFVLKVTNVGSLQKVDGDEVTVTDTLDPDLFSDVGNATGDGWSCSTTDNFTVTCTRSDALDAGGSYPDITVPVKIAAEPPEDVCNTATVAGGDDTNSTNNRSEVCEPSANVADMAIRKFASPGISMDQNAIGARPSLDTTSTKQAVTVYSGDTVTFTLPVRNLGPSTAADVTVEDRLKPGAFTNVKATTTQGSCDTRVRCDLGPMDAGADATVTITATVVDHDATINNRAVVSSTQGNVKTLDRNPLNDFDVAEVIVPPTADLSITKRGTGSNPQDGQPYTYTLTVTNNGPDDADRVVVNDQLPAQFTATSAGGGGFTCALPNNGGPGGTLLCTRDALAPADGPQEITVVGTFAPGNGTAQEAVNASSVSSDTPDSDLTNNVATVDFPILPQADINLTKRALLADGETPVTGPLDPGQDFIYELGLTNFGPSVAANVTVTDRLPAPITVNPAAPLPSGCSFNLASSTVTCTIPSLPVGATDLQIPVKVPPGASGGDVVNDATVGSTTPDPNPDNNTDTSVVGVAPVADLMITKGVSKPAATDGDVVTYTLDARNVGVSPTGAVVTDKLPAGLSFVSSKRCTASGADTVTCGPVALAAGASTTFSFDARVEPGHAGETLVNHAHIDSADAGTGFPLLPELTLGNNDDAAELAVAAGQRDIDEPQSDLSITKRAGHKVVSVNGVLTYNLDVTNHGPAAATNVVITDPIPKGLAFVMASHGCVDDNGTLTCTILSLGEGQSVPIRMMVRILPGASGKMIKNTASVGSRDDEDPNAADNDATAEIRVRTAANVHRLHTRKPRKPHAKPKQAPHPRSQPKPKPHPAPTSHPKSGPKHHPVRHPKPPPPEVTG